MTMKNQMTKELEDRGRLDIQLKSELAQLIRDLGEDSTEGRRCFTREEVLGRLHERLEVAGWTDMLVTMALLQTLGIVEEAGRRGGKILYRLTAKGRAEGPPSGRDRESEAFELILQQLKTDGLIQILPPLN
jgi:hypothetical protein